MFSKISVVIALACCLLVSAARAQTPIGRIGPAEDVPAATGSAEKKTEKSDPKTDPKKNVARETKKDAAKKDEAKKDEPKTDEPAKSDPQPTPTPLTAATNTAAEKSPNNTTTDAPTRVSTTPARTVSPPLGLIPAPPEYESPTPINADGAKIPTAATTNTPAPVVLPTAIYRVGVGDVLDIRLVNGTARDSTLYTILSGGMLDYPLAGDPVSVGGLTTEEVGARLATELKRRGIFDRAQFNVSVRDYTSHTVHVSGLVDQPGAKVLRREAVPLYVVLTEALPRADAGRAVIISRATGTTRTVDLSDGDALNQLVAAGDVVNVQTRPPEFYFIGGLIAQPGQKDFHVGLTLTQALLASGGVPLGAKDKVRVTVSRQGADGRLIATDYLLKEIEGGKVPDPRLQPGDRIEVERKH